tara:strand:+ start:2411 stop:2755 length:345 start_codon:yes stop_codon:yes gene_type:complete
MLNAQKVQEFRSDFSKAIAQLEKDHGVTISLGTIRFDANELRAKMTAKVGDAPARAPKYDFNVGDLVGITHKKIRIYDEFKILKINRKNIKVEQTTGIGFGAIINVSPNLLVKK